MRAMSFFTFLISLGVSNRSVADCTRRWNSCLTASLSVNSSCSSGIPRYSAAFMVVLTPLDARQPRHEPALERHLVGDAGQGVARRRLGQPADLEEDHARLDDRRPVLRFALALA